MNRTNDFMLNLVKTLVEVRKVAESTANLYVKNLWTLNNGVPYKNLSFLRKTADVDAKLSKYADSTRKTYLASIVSVLSLMKDKPTYKKIYQHYYDLMMKKASEMKANETDGKTEKQEENWLTWDEVLAIKNSLNDAVKQFVNNKQITNAQFNMLLAYLVLSLYTDIPPRRNQDYADMYVVPKWNEAMDKNKNYYELVPAQFIFNRYKTAKKYGTQTLAVPPSLVEAIAMYLKHHPLHKGKMTKNTEFKFLVYADGSPLTAVNSITRILNKVFGRKIGSSMMRHIYLSSKYSDVKEEQKEDAVAMGHSVAEQQNTYVKN